MPASFMGFGTSLCKGRGQMLWPDGEEVDGLECVVLFGLPVWPLRAVHTFGWGKTKTSKGFTQTETTGYRSVELRWSSSLVRMTFLYEWSIGLCAVGVIALIALLAGVTEGKSYAGDAAAFMHTLYFQCAVTGVIALGSGIVGFVRHGNLDRRHRRVRLLLGQHSLGSSDPVTWQLSTVQQCAPRPEEFGAPSFAQAVPLLLEKGDLSRALWAARWTTRVEAPATGEQLTDLVLADPRTIKALREIDADPTERTRVLERAMGSR